MTSLNGSITANAECAALTFSDMVSDPCAYFASERFSPDQLCSAADCLAASGLVLENQPRWAIVELAREVLLASAED